jgi:uncharacterized protein (DUF4415 family)
MSANAKSIKPQKVRLPTLDDVAMGRVSLDDYEIAHGEDIPELTEEDMKNALPISEVPLLAQFYERMRGMRGPQKAPVKERVGLRLDADVVEHFRATGSGWQARVNEILKQHVAGKDK